jgi:DNA-binding NarL/FixJ family response regulator
MSLRVLVVDDHPLYRDGLVTAISAMPDVEVVGDAADASLPCERRRSSLQTSS